MHVGIHVYLYGVYISFAGTYMHISVFGGAGLMSPA